MNSHSRANFNWILPALILLFLSLRLTVLLSGGMHAFEAEELYRGTISRELIDGLKMPLLDYQADHYSGGSLLVGLAAVPFFFLLGPSLFALKLAPLLFALLTLILLWFFTKRNFGQEAAFFSALFFILAPPSFMRLSLVAMGFHSESILFSMLTLCTFYRYFYEDRQSRDLFLFGLFSGLGFWFTHITIMIPVACMLAWIFLDLRSLFDRKNLAVLSVSIFAGILPWILYNFTHHFEGVGFIVKNLLHLTGQAGNTEPSAFSFNGKRFFDLVCKAIPMSLAFDKFHTVSRRAVCLIYFIIGTGLSAPLYFSSLKNWFRRSKEDSADRLLPILLIPFVFIFVYWLSSVEINAVTEPDFFYLFFDDCRYFVPFHFAFLMLLGISSAGSPLRKVFAVFLLALGLWGFTSISFLEPWGETFHYKGYSYSQLGALRGHIWPKLYPNFESYLKSLERYKKPEDRFFVFWSSLYGLQFEKNLSDPEKIKRLMENTAIENRPHMAQGIGYAIGAQGGLNAAERIPVLNLIPQEYYKYFYSGFVDATINQGPETLEDFLQFARTLPPEIREVFYFELGQICPYERKPGGLNFILKRPHQETDTDLKAFFRGLGVRCMVNWIMDGFEFSQAVKNLGFIIPQIYQSDFLWGIGWGLCQQTTEDLPRGIAALQEIPEEKRNQVLSGFQDCKMMYAIPEKGSHA